MENYINIIIEKIYTETNLKVYATTPPKPEMGDIAIPCFTLSKELMKNPKDIYNQLESAICKLNIIDSIQFNGGYLNIFLNRKTLISDTLKLVLKEKAIYGSSRSGIGKRLFIEHTSINPNASPHIGRARNAIIGDSITKLFKFEGYDVEVHYFVNDIGKQIAMLLIGTKDKELLSFNDLLDIYIDINAKVSTDSALEKEVFKLLYKLENGDAETINKFKSIVDICIKGQTEILKKLNINYDYFDYESDYIFGNRLNDIIEDLRDTQNLFEDDEGRYVLNFENENLSYLVLTRADKTSLYPLRDIAYTIDKSKGNYNRNVIILGEDQKTYFQQIKQTVSLLGYQAPEFVHYSFVLLTDGKMSTRNGKVVLLEDFMKEAIIKANYEINKRERTTDESTIESIAYGALKYAILKVSNDKNVTFDWETALNFEGESAPYIQYSYARICSIFKNYGKELPSHIDFSLLDTIEEFELAKEISKFPDIIKRTASELSMHILANYLFELTKKFSKFYHEHSVLNAETNKLKESRLILIYTVKIVLENGLKILGINPIEEM